MDLSGCLASQARTFSKSAPPSMRPVIFMPKPCTTSAAARTPVMPSAIVPGWTIQSPMRRSR